MTENTHASVYRAPEEPDKPSRPEDTTTDSPPMQGRQILSYFLLLFVFLILTRAFFSELNTRFDLAVFPTIAAGIRQALDVDAAFDSVVNTVFSLLYSFLFSLPIAIVYRVTKEEERFDPALSQTIVLLSMVVTAVMVVIAGDLARAFGLAGVVAAVRFRNTLDDAKDAVYVFLAIAVGMACGAKAFAVGLWTSIILTAALYFMWRYQFGRLPGALLAVREKPKKTKKNGKGEKAKDKKDKKDKKGKKDRKNERTQEERGPEEKAPNARLLIEARDLALAQGYAEQELALVGGRWRLATINALEGGGGTLGFLGRLSKKKEPSTLLRALLANRTLIQSANLQPLAWVAEKDAREMEELTADQKKGPSNVRSGTGDS